ncbi:MAG: hypothetical protein ACLRMJ_03215 [Alistipes finegoldii]
MFGSARDIFAAAPDELAGEAGLREEIAREIVRRRGFAAAEKELEHCRRNGIAAIASTDPEYPRSCGNPRLSPCPIHKR